MLLKINQHVCWAVSMLAQQYQFKLIINYPTEETSMFKLSYLLLSLPLLVLAFNPCQNIEFKDYSYNLQDLPTFILPVTNTPTTKYASITLCSPQPCGSTPNGQSTMVRLLGNAGCEPYTIDTILRDRIHMYNPSQPKYGLTLDLLPYHPTPNTTLTATLILTCPDHLASTSTCTLESSHLNCTTAHQKACPQLTHNHFQQFLQARIYWLAIPIWLFSLFELVMGYFWIRVTLTLYGVLTGSVLGIVLSAITYSNSFYDLQTTSIMNWIVLMSIAIGALLGVVLLTLPKTAYANIGIWVALITSLLLQNSLFFLTGSLLAFYITFGILSVIMLAISLLRFRKFIIVSTAFTSSFWLIRSLGLVLPHYPNELDTVRLHSIDEGTPWQFYLYLVSILLLTVLGSLVQFCWYIRRGREENQGYYLENDDSLKEKFKKLLEFEDVRELIREGKKEIGMLKKIVADSSDEQEQYSESRQIEMKKIQRLKDERDEPKQSKAIISGKRVKYEQVSFNESSLEAAETPLKRQNKPVSSIAPASQYRRPRVIHSVPQESQDSSPVNTRKR